tara:strand:- start:38715 stop:38960 length:246 start_codon:yes stop_codon:yes gene_type:complete
MRRATSILVGLNLIIGTRHVTNIHTTLDAKRRNRTNLNNMSNRMYQSMTTSTARIESTDTPISPDPLRRRRFLDDLRIPSS